MKSHHLSDFPGGWFVGAFHPSILTTSAAEVAVKSYRAGDHEPAHVHRIATEITVVAAGRVRLGQREWGAGDIIVLEPGEPAEFTALTDAQTVVVKIPSVPGDKYPA